MIALIGTARYETLLRRLLSTKGSEAAPLLSPEIQPVLVVQGDAPELDILRGVNRQGAQGFQGAVAGQFSGQILNNPAGSGVIAIVEQVHFTGSAGLFSFGHATLGIGVVSALQRPLDRRNAGTSSALTLNNVAQVGGFVTAVLAIENELATTTERIINPGIIVAPGTAFGISVIFNTICRSSWIWRERSLEQSEEA